MLIEDQLETEWKSVLKMFALVPKVNAVKQRLGHYESVVISGKEKAAILSPKDSETAAIDGSIQRFL